MSRSCANVSAGGGLAAALGAANGLHFAAAPVFALMALLTSASGGDTICGMASPFGGMAPMYLLMSAFHLPPWLRLIARWL